MAYKLVCFDVDGTLVDNIEYSWQLFHNHFKTDQKKREDAMRKYYAGEISYEQWAMHDISMWNHATRGDFLEAMKSSGISLMPGSRETITALKQRGMKVAIISGSISVILEYLLPDYEQLFDDIFLTRLFFDEEGRIARIHATPFDMEGKAVALRKIAQREKLSLKECVFVGDHQNDIAIAKEAGLAIAFDPKDKEFEKCCHVCIRKKDVREIIPFILR